MPLENYLPFGEALRTGAPENGCTASSWDDLCAVGYFVISFVKSSSETPLMRQYRSVKEKHPGTILLFRLGDFYETFGDDAVATAKACGITLTKRNNGAAGDIPLAGFPHHQLDAYLPRLVKAGHRVAVCEQLEDPKQAKGIVKRDVVEVVTPGVVLYDKLLDHSANTFLAAIVRPTTANGVAGLCIADVSTGMFTAGDINAERFRSMIESFRPAEIIVSKDDKEWWEPIVKGLSWTPAITRLESWIFERDFADTILLRQFETKNLKGFGTDELTTGILAAGAVLQYVSDTQRGALAQITGMRVLRSDETMILDTATRRNLEIHASMNGDGSQGALVSVLDRTVTAMGARMLRWWLRTPLVHQDRIERRLRVVRGCYRDAQRTAEVRSVLAEIADIERLITKVATNRATARDLGTLRSSLMVLPKLKNVLEESPFPDVAEIGNRLNIHTDLCAYLLRVLSDEPPLAIGTGKMFRTGFHAALDEATDAMLHGKEWMTAYQERERAETGIPTLKVSFTGVFGYFIEVPNTHRARVPERFVRRQTLANAERYTTTELKDYEQKILTAETSVTTLETALLDEVRKYVATHTAELQQTSQLVASTDVLCGFADAAIAYGYAEPTIHAGTELKIVDARHPVIERILPHGVVYTPNTVRMDTTESQLHILTGPNMSGKSSYLRQVGLIVFLAHVGSFVPATSATIPLTDRIFTRVGAQDNVMAGESTFLVEMQEAANILNNATERSLILLDEVGRGTATFDGISIAWAIAEFLHEDIRAKTIFATHYHELTALADVYERARNFQVEVREVADNIVFTHRVTTGHSDHSFGIHVAKMAGLPPSVINTATTMLAKLESGNSAPAGAAITATVERKRLEEGGQISLFQVRDDELRGKVRNLDINSMTPLEAMKVLAELKDAVNE